jgi:hypothetical protein
MSNSAPKELQRFNWILEDFSRTSNDLVADSRLVRPKFVTKLVKEVCSLPLCSRAQFKNHWQSGRIKQDYYDKKSNIKLMHKCPSEEPHDAQ